MVYFKIRPISENVYVYTKYHNSLDFNVEKNNFLFSKIGDISLFGKEIMLN